MALQTSGQISMDDLATEFGGTTPHSLSEYYRGGGLVPDISSNNSIPTSGQIELDDFYGAQDLNADAITYQSYVQGQSGTIRDIGMVSETYDALATAGWNNANTLFAFDFTAGGYKLGTNSQVTNIYDLSQNNFHISNGNDTDRPTLTTDGFLFVHTENDRFTTDLSTEYTDWGYVIWLDISGYTEDWGFLNGYGTLKNCFFTRNGSSDLLYYRDDALNYHTLSMTGVYDDWVMIAARGNSTNIKVYVNGYEKNTTWSTGNLGRIRLDNIGGRWGGSVDGVIGKIIATTDGSDVSATAAVDFYNATKHHYGL